MNPDYQPQGMPASPVFDFGQFRSESESSDPPTPPTPGPRYHPDFTACSSGMNVDVTLVARDGTHFRINAATLRSSSGVFETTLSLPQSVETEWKEPVIDSLDEDSEVLEDLLRIISGKEISPDRLTSLDHLQPRLLAAEKWDMGGVLSIMRVLLCTNPDMSSLDPMRVYWLGTHFGWRDVTSAASKYSCNDDLFHAEKQSLLSQVDVTDLLRLMNFHKARKDGMKALLATIPPHFHLKNRLRPELSAEYQNFIWNFLQEMDHTPPARKISDDKLLSMSVEARLGAYPCRSCNAGARHNSEVFMQIHRYWDTLEQKMTV